MTQIDRETYEHNKHRPAWVRRHRAELQTITGLEIPRSLPAVADWLETRQPHLTTQMRAYFDTDADDEPTETETDSTPTDGGAD